MADVKGFKSKAQRDRCLKLMEEKKMTPEQFNAMMAATPDPINLPDRIGPKKEE